MTIQEIIHKYKDKIDYLDLEILIADSLDKTREFVLIHPEFEINSKILIRQLLEKISRRIKSEPLAYILGRKEFYGLDFIVNKHTLVPRPETEMLVAQALSTAINHQSLGEKITIIDIGTGSGCIITSIASELEKNNSLVAKNLDSLPTRQAGRLRGNDKIKYYATDISEGALKIAKKNTKIHGLDKKIKFLHGSLLTPLIENCKLKIENSRMIILANLPYLSKEIYNSTPIDVKKFEPKSALYSPELGLKHYRELLEQLQKLLVTSYGLRVAVFLEISPEQKTLLAKIIKNIFPKEKMEFKKDLAGKWRICKIDIVMSS